MAVTVYPVGDRGITLSCTQAVSIENQRRIWWIAQNIKEDYILDIIPGMNNITVTFDAYHDIDKAYLKSLLIELWHLSESASFTNTSGKLVEVPVFYGGEKGPDLLEVSKAHKISPHELIELHTAAIYTVYFVGFMPGFVYLGGLNPAIHTPRRAEPRLKIPSGSVGIGGAQTGVYPEESPGGWQIIGNTNMKFFDSTREDPSLFLPGDQLQFVVEGAEL